MIKVRNSLYCNLKLLLIFFVIYGHLIEPYIYENSVFAAQYRLIYLFHMPLFSFLSGLFVNSRKACAIQGERLLTVYLILQTAASLSGKGTVNPLIPCWYLWYLLSYSCWIFAARLLFSLAESRYKYAVTAVAVLLGCFSGYIEGVGRVLSLSRTIVFFPYFWLGIICDKNTDWKKYRRRGLAGFSVSAVLFFLAGEGIPVSFLYHADPFDDNINGAILRFFCYVFGFMTGFFLLTFMPERIFSFTKLGADTMPAYIAQAPFVLLLRELNLTCLECVIGSGVYLWAVYKVTGWYGSLYRVDNSERRREKCRIFRKYMKNTDEKYTDFCCPYPETKP